MADNGAIFPLFYLPPVSFFTEFLQHKNNFLIEQKEYFPKQTYRNRAQIYSPDGALTLVVPVEKGSKNHRVVKDVKISYDFNWQRLHWLSLECCYRSSAYFEYYEADFAPFYQEKKYMFLFDYNEALLRLLLKLMKLKVELNFTEAYEASTKGLDFRKSIHPKLDYDFQQKTYFQVFDDRKGFLKNLSIVDLLFNQGPNTLNYL
ncbi:WbqC family protein [Mucilaginibacter arboris]|uniref:WbqC family protein n=1 Tax=Mucilaginibacter arboris TaxID=2682090 RepID=A0A7K1SXU4_9SPHI|nr:WbqC family protein [Mucilaginibacter arboris]MVN22136.1 hypothetical protein [Mucilaginibacter arboris]